MEIERFTRPKGENETLKETIKQYERDIKSLYMILQSHGEIVTMNHNQKTLLIRARDLIKSNKSVAATYWLKATDYLEEE